MDLPFGKLEPNSNQIFLDYGTYVLAVCKDDALFSITALLCQWLWRDFRALLKGVGYHMENVSGCLHLPFTFNYSDIFHL